PVPLAPGHTMLVNMRAERATDQAVVICRWSGRQWEQVPTARVGTDIYAAQLAAVAPVAVVRLDRGVAPTVPALAGGSSGSNPGASGQAAGASAGTATPAAASGGGPGGNILWLALGVIVVVLAGTLLLLRRRAGPAGADDAPRPPG